jgi:hypothetical protein
MNFVEVVIILNFEDGKIATLKKHTFRFPVGHDIRFELDNLSYEYSPNATASSESPSTFIEFDYEETPSDFPLSATPQPGQRVTLNLDLALDFPDLYLEPMGTIEPFLPLYETGFAYFGSLVILPSDIAPTKTYSSDISGLRLQYERRTGIDLNVQYDTDGTYIVPVDDAETLTTIIKTKNAEINFFNEQIIISIYNPTDIVHFFAPTKTYIVSNQMLFTSPVQFILPKNTASLYERWLNELSLYLSDDNKSLPIPLTGEEFDVNFNTDMVILTTNKLFGKIDPNTSIAHVTIRNDRTVQDVQVYNTSVYGYKPSENRIFLVVGFSYVSKLQTKIDKTPESTELEFEEPEFEVLPDIDFEVLPDLEFEEPEFDANTLTDKDELTPTQPTNVSVGTGIAGNYIPPTPDVPLPKELRIDTISDCVGIGEPSISDVVWDDYTARTVTYKNCPPVTKYYDGYPFSNYVPTDVVPRDNYPESLKYENRSDDTSMIALRNNTPLPTERTVTDNKPLGTEPTLYTEPEPTLDTEPEPTSTDKPVVNEDKPTSIVNEKWFPVVIVVPIVVIIAIIVGIVIYRKRSAKAKAKQFSS